MDRSSQPTNADELCSNRAGVVVIVSSAGGIEALTAVLAALPRTFPIPIVIAQHLSRSTQSRLPEVLEWATGFPAAWVCSGAVAAGGMAYVVRPNDSAQLGHAGFVTATLPDTLGSWFASVDKLLESVAAAYGATAIAIVLSGMLPAGIRGLRAIKAQGGIVMAQSLKSSAHAGMPIAAHDEGKAEIIFSPQKMAEALLALVESRASERAALAE